jgi:prolyl oligopeptidase PreP (S9A serine peptidase family)
MVLNGFNAGTKCKKQNVFDDFIAADRIFLKKIYSTERTSATELVQMGALLGATLTP